jgi:hypothetical protein
MTPRLLALGLVPVLAFPCGARATVADRYAFKIDAPQSKAQYEIESSLGPCVLRPVASGHFSGNTVLQLQWGTIPFSIPFSVPFSEGRFDGGECVCSPDLFGAVPNSVPGLPPLLELRLSGLVVRPRSRTFSCDADGVFHAEASCEVANGKLEVRVLGGPIVPVSLAGLGSDRARAHGKIWIDDSGVHLVREVGNVIALSVPELDIDLRISLRGVIRGDMDHPIPTRSGSPVTTDHFETGLLPRNGSIHAGTNGTGSGAFDLHMPPAAGEVVAGSRWKARFACCAVAAGGAMFSAPDAVAVDFVP